MKKLILIVLCIPFLVFGQDKMILFDQESRDFDDYTIKYKDLLCKVLEIDDNNIKYKKFSNITGPTFLIKKSEVYMIKYSNGTSETITVKENDDPLSLLIWLNQGNVGTKEEVKTKEDILASLPACYKKTQKERREDFMAVFKLYQWDYIDVPQLNQLRYILTNMERKDFDPLYPPDPPNITSLLSYQKNMVCRNYQ